MKKVIEYLRPFFKRMSVGLSIKFAGSIMDLLLPWILAYLVDTVAPTRSISRILLWGGVMVLCSAFALATNVIANRMAAKVAADTTRALRHDLFHKVIHLSQAQIDELSIPSLEARMTTDTYNVHQMIGMMQRMGVRAPILLLGGIFVTLTLEPVLALTLISVLPFIAFVVWYISRQGIPLYTKVQQATDNMVRIIRENIAGIRVVKALSKTDYEKARFESANMGLVQKERHASMTMALTNPLMNVLLNLGLTLVIVVGAYRINLGISQPGKIIAFLSYFTIILTALMAITRMFVMYSRGTASAQRISGVLELPQDLQTRPCPPREEEAHIVFDDVSFSYNKRRENITNISLSLKRGETLGVIGAIGSGKSTLIHLLMRLYDMDKGEIRISGRPLPSIPEKELHTLFGVVFQNDALFADTIEENIRFGRPMSREQVERAARLAQAWEFISALPEGLSHRLTARGTNVSGGQKQRILIARALASQPEILILDDSSSALDYQTDALLRQAIRQEYADTTSIIIAQRVSSILHADHILVLEHGEMLGYGTHGQLLETCALYREIYQSQMGGEA